MYEWWSLPSGDERAKMKEVYYARKRVRRSPERARIDSMLLPRALPEGWDVAGGFFVSPSGTRHLAAGASRNMLVFSLTLAIENEETAQPAADI